MINKLKNERIFVAGHTGMVGSAVCRLLKKNYINSNHGNILLTPSRKELNLFDKELVEKWFKLNKPSIVIIAAAKVGGIIANAKQPANFLLDNLNIQTNIICKVLLVIIESLVQCSIEMLFNFIIFIYIVNMFNNILK